MLYFVEDSRDGCIKIGFTDRPIDRRLPELQPGNPRELEVIATFPGGKADERALHQRFAPFWVRGEWFEDCHEIRCYLRARRIGPDPLLLTFLDAKIIEPHLCYVISTSVGFACSIFAGGSLITGSDKDQYQVMRWDEAPGRGLAFWHWYVWEMPQWFETPAEAAAEFVRWWNHWKSLGKNPE